MLFLTFITGGPETMLTQGTGLLSAHLFDFLTRIWPRFGGGRNWIETPAIVRRAFGDAKPGPRTRGYGTAFSERAVGASDDYAWSSAFNSAWGTRGTGRRLGGD